MNAAELADMIIARFRENINLVNESDVLVKDKAKVACRVTLRSCFLRPISRNSVLEELRVRRLACIQDEICCRPSCRREMFISKSEG